MPIISKPLYVYLQRPDDGAWVTVGRYVASAPGEGTFMYAPSYVDSGLAWAIDPVNLPFVPGTQYRTRHYRGLHDVLRDACPDAWGQALLRREYNLPADAPPLQYLIKAGNIDRWGALAVGSTPRFSGAALNSPPLPLLDQLVEELAALAEHRPPVRPAIRRRLVQTASVGGARPKTTVRDDAGAFWLVKPRMLMDPADIPRLEHFALEWGAASGLDVAETVLHPGPGGRSVLRVRRFDRDGGRRFMCVSAASLLQAEYPDNPAHTDRWSYPRLAEELRRVGAPPEDGIELFGRMVFNAVCGNDDDHVRNHAIVHGQGRKGWRLAPAFDVVPNPAETPRRLVMQLSRGRFDIARDAVLGDAVRFGFTGRDACAAYLDALLARIEAAFPLAAAWLTDDWRATLHARMTANLAILRGT
ncbi:type II toxin-antitoxin system HipA family toxin [Massilia sp. CT11-108]|uniref:type II toxin-antitoxin system HipA family toxin n=1 Tax=Massilia sp. CT11-108 TaxID=3393900 RepID=UPI0039A53A1E